MQCITTVLNESEALTVRKAVCTLAGAERVVITPIPYREKIIAESSKQVRLDVTADDSMAGSIVAVIRRIAHAGRIALAPRHARLPRRAA